LGNGLGNLFTAYRNQAPLVVTAGQQARSLLLEHPYLFAESAAEFPKLVSMLWFRLFSFVCSGSTCVVLCRFGLFASSFMVHVVVHGFLVSLSMGDVIPQ
jgi:hypothetical protein